MDHIASCLLRIPVILCCNTKVKSVQCLAIYMYVAHDSRQPALHSKAEALYIRVVKELTIGVYRVELAPGYIQDELDYDGSDVFLLDTSTEDPHFLRIRKRNIFKIA